MSTSSALICQCGAPPPEDASGLVVGPPSQPSPRPSDPVLKGRGRVGGRVEPGGAGPEGGGRPEGVRLRTEGPTFPFGETAHA